VLTEGQTGPASADGLGERVREFLAGHDPARMPRLEFLRARFDAGLAAVHYPEGLGGLGLPRALQGVVEAEFAAAGAPGNQPERIGIGLGMAATWPGWPPGRSLRMSPEPRTGVRPRAPHRTGTARPAPAAGW